MSQSLPRVTAIAAVGLFATLAMASCGSKQNEGGAAPTTVSSDVPSYYGKEYEQVIEAAEDESGKLTIYSDTSAENWEPVFRDFKRKYPFVKEVSAADLDSDEVFERYLSESATSGSSADLLEANAPSAWAKFAETGEGLMDYESPELDKLPAYASPMPGVVAMSIDPMGIVYNTALMPEAPTSIEHLSSMVLADPENFDDKITTRDIESSFGFSISKAFADTAPGTWKSLEGVLPKARPETSSGTQIEKILGGEYLAGFFISAAPAYPIIEDSEGLVGLAFPEDGTVVIPRGVGIAKNAPNPNTAKLFEDFLLSAEGQRAVAEGGLTSYRDGIEGDGLHTFQQLQEEVGDDSITFVEYTAVSPEDAEAFTNNWNGLLAK